MDTAKKQVSVKYKDLHRRALNEQKQHSGITVLSEPHHADLYKSAFISAQIWVFAAIFELSKDETKKPS
ncbi:MAG: hypothetical protein KZQ58_05060 [gamma proteobacterium symbiont of Bathyaustriella thionipta]|nr:hypothetical protein [gamma proteobacterium symbiont of Bathyaustriella thionipta]